jgi:gliding-associated putative ABC transporter substrate-binding component GldG
MSRMSRGGATVLYVLLVLAILVEVNVISSRKYGRVDLTTEKIYTISPASKKLVRSLPDRMTVKAFISRDLPPKIKSFGRYISDMVLEYGAISKGRLQAEVIYIDAEDEQARKEAQRYKIRPLKVGQRSSAKSSVQLAYLGVAFQYGGKIEALPQTLSLNDLEYQLSSTIRRITRKKQLKVGFTAGHGEPSLARGLANAKRYLKDYAVVSVDLKNGKKPIPQDVDVLVVVGPRKRFAERAKYELDRFLMSGKGVAFFLDGMTLETPRGKFAGRQPPRIGRANATGLESMLAHWGVKIDANIVMDSQNRPLPLVAGGGRAVLVSYPAFPLVTNFSKKSPITKMLRQALMVFPSSLSLTAEARADKLVESEVLAQSSANSWAHKGIFIFDPMRIPKPTKTVGPFTLGLSLKGAFRSYFAGRPVPKAGPALGPRAKAAAPKGDKRAPSGARLVVVGDAEFVRDQYLRLNPNNLLVLLNAVDYLAQDERLIGIRAKRQTRRPMAHKEEGDIFWLKWGNVIGVPLLFVLLGIGRWRWRAGQRVRQAEELLAERALRHPVQTPSSDEDDDEDEDEDEDEDDEDDEDDDDEDDEDDEDTKEADKRKDGDA